MRKKRKSYSADFKLNAVSRMAGAKTITGLATELGVRRKFLYEWRDKLRNGGKAALERGRGRPPGSQSKTVPPATPNAAELRIAELERLLGRKQLELDFFKRTFEQVRGAAASHTSDGGKGSIAQSKPRSRSKA
ncbi:MAG TPA: helix-turn-helix domain-containing protein [Acidisarcina sp.]